MWIEKLPNGKFKYFERYKDPYTEKDRRVSVTLNSKSNQAKKQALAELQDKIRKRKKDPLKGKMIWKNVYDEWWDIYKNTVKFNTIRSRIRDQKKIAQKFSDDLLIEKIDSNFLSDFLNYFYYDENLSKSYIEQLHAHLNLVFKYAESRKYIKSNPMKDVKINAKPKTLEQIEKSRNKYLEREELNDVLRFMRTKNIRYANLVEFMVLTGTRIGETVALKFEDIDSNFIEIKSTYTRETKSHGTPKNEYSYRKIETTDRVLEIVEQQKELYNQYLNTWKNFKDNNYIFFSTGGLPIHDPDLNSFLKKTVMPNVNINNKNLTTHVFRHTHISLLAELGVPLKTIMERVGHNNPNTTLSIYTHVTQNMKTEIKDKLNSLNIAP